MKLMKFKRVAVTVLIVLAAYLLQCTLFNHLELAGIKPNLILIVTASFGFMRGQKEGMLVGFFAGLITDIQFGTILGFYALLYLVIGFVNGLFEQLYFDEDIKLPLFLISVSEFLYGIIIYLLMFMLRSDFNFLYYLNRIIVPELIYTIVITLGLYPLILFINHKLEAEEKGGHIGAGIFNYPSLMNADILMYDPDYVPVGEDQKQHVELARNVAERFNSRYSDTFKLPEPIIPKVGGRIMDLQDPTKKMSKSSPNGKGCIYVLDPINVSKKKILSAVTDSDSHVKFDPENKPGISNLLEIYSIISGKTIEELETMYEGKGYGDFKKDLAEVVGDELQRIQDRYNEVLDGDYLDNILEAGAEKARRIARKKLAKVERKIGITIKKK